MATQSGVFSQTYEDIQELSISHVLTWTGMWNGDDVISVEVAPRYLTNLFCV